MPISSARATSRSAAPRSATDLQRRAAIHHALGEPARLSIVDELALTDRSPKDLGERLDMPTNLLTHHLDVLESVGLVVRFTSSGDRRRKYVRLVREPLASLRPVRPPVPIGALSPDPAHDLPHDLPGDLPGALFLCTHNSARSQLAAALWTARTGRPAESAGTHPADRVHRGAVVAARLAGLDLSGATPSLLGRIDPAAQVVTVCDRAHEELEPADDWWHWSIPDPVETGTAAAFEAVIADLDARITTVLAPTHSPTPIARPGDPRT